MNDKWISKIYLEVNLNGELDREKVVSWNAYI